MTNGQWELEELEAVLEPEEGTQRSVSCRWKHGGLGPMGELGARSGPGLSGLLRAARATQCSVVVKWCSVYWAGLVPSQGF